MTEYDPWRPPTHPDTSDSPSVPTAPATPFEPLPPVAPAATPTAAPLDDGWVPGPPKPGAAGVPLPPVPLPPGAAAPVPDPGQWGSPGAPAGGWAGDPAPSGWGVGPVRYSATPYYTRRNVEGLVRLVLGALLLGGVAAPWFVVAAGDDREWVNGWTFRWWREGDLVAFKTLAVVAGVTAGLALLVAIFKPRLRLFAALASLGGAGAATGSIYNLVAGWGSSGPFQVYGGPGLFAVALGGVLCLWGGIRAALTSS